MIITQLLLVAILIALIFNGIAAAAMYSGPSEDQVSNHMSRLDSQLTKINNELRTIRDDLKSLKPPMPDLFDPN